MQWIPGQARNDVGVGLVVEVYGLFRRSGFRVKPGMTWIWGWAVVYGLFRLVWIPGQARNDA